MLLSQIYHDNRKEHSIVASSFERSTRKCNMLKIFVVVEFTEPAFDEVPFICLALETYLSRKSWKHDIHRNAAF